MKRDMELVRDLLLYCERVPDFDFHATHISGPQFDSRERYELIGHLMLLESGGFLAKEGPGRYRMTWEGHEFLDTVRDPEVWQKTKQGADRVGSWSVKLLADLASGFVRAKAADLGLPLA